MPPKRKKATRAPPGGKRRNGKKSAAGLPKKASKRSASTTSSAPAKQSKSSSCSSGVQVLPTPAKAFVDPNTYKLIKLKNGILALLIHQPPKSANPKFCLKTRGQGSSFRMSYHRSYPSTKFLYDEGFSFQNEATETEKCWDFNFTSHQSSISSVYPQTISNQVSRSKRIKDSNKASLAVVVNVGSTSDCNYRSGLAHFCEHMIHYGTSKFPDVESQIKYVLTKGDDFNASTSAMLTDYYYCVNQAFIDEGCDRMSEMISNPLFDSTMVRKEVQSVDNEFFLRSHSDSEAYLLIIWSFAKKNHPIRMFSCGNVHTLLPTNDSKSVDKLRDDLVHFHHSNYVGSAMTLAMQSNESIQWMEKVVVKHFEQIPKGEKCIRKDMKIPDHHKNPFQTKEFNKFYFVCGKQPSPHVVISWALDPEVWKDLERKPFDFWGSLIRDEREFGLAYNLRRNGFISDISASVGDIDYCKNEFCTMFEVDLGLAGPWFYDENESLICKIEILLQALFENIAKLRSMSLEQKTLLWNEFSAPKNATFEHSIPAFGAEFTQECAKALQTDFEIFTSVNKVIPEYQDDIMTRYLDMITTKNMNVMTFIQGKVLLKRYSAELKSFPDEGYERHTDTEYWGRAFPKKLITSLNNLLKKGQQATLPCIIPVNPYFSGVKDMLSGLCCVNKIPPQAFLTNEKCRVEHYGNGGLDWYLAECRVNIYSSASVLRFHATNLCHLLLLKACVCRIILPISCAAEKCGMQVAILVCRGSMKLQFIGFPEKLSLVIGQVLRCIFPPEGDQEGAFPRNVFDIAKSDVINNLTDELGSSTSLIESLFEELFTLECPSFRNVISILSSITYENFVCFTKLYSNCSFLHARTDGNVPFKTCENIATIINGLNFFPRIDGWEKSLDFVRPETTMLPYDPRCARVKSEFRSDQNSIVVNFYQFTGHVDDSTLYFLVLYMRAPFFIMLRMEQQLGYRLSIDLGVLRSPFISVSVMFPAHKKSLCEVDSAIDTFFVKFGERYLSTLSEAEFQEQKLLWAISETLTLQQVRDFFQKTFMRHMQPRGRNDCGGPLLEWTHEPGKIRKLSIQVLGKRFEKCRNTRAHCDKSRWTKPRLEKNQPISFTADEYDTAFPYFIKDPQWFRDGRYR